jgi:hypothetical protein
MIEQMIECPFQKESQCDIVYYDDDLLTIQSVTDFVRLNRHMRTFYLPDTKEKIVDLCRDKLDFFVTPDTDDVDIAIAIGPKINIHESDIERISGNGTLLLANLSAIGKSAVDMARSRNLEIVRLDLSETLVGEVTRLFGTKERLQVDAGTHEYENLQIVSGGYIGNYGDPIVNSISTPTKIIGVSDGYGGVLPVKALGEEQYRKLMEWILLNL